MFAREALLHQTKHGQLIGVHHRAHGWMRDGVVGGKLRPNIIAHDRDESTFVSHRVAIVRCREYGDAFSYTCNSKGMTSP